MDYGLGEEKNKRVQTVIDQFMLQIAEKEYIARNGYSMRAEKFANFLITNGPDGVGVFIFEDGTPWQMWRYTKVIGLISFEEKPAELYRTIDDIMNSNEDHTLTLMNVPFGENGGTDVTRKQATIYSINGTSVRPFEDFELEEVASTVGDLGIAFGKGQEWTYDPYGEYMKLEV